MENAEVIQSFFDEAGSVDIFDTLKGMVACLDLLVAPSKGKRMLIMVCIAAYFGIAVFAVFLTNQVQFCL